MKTIRNPYVQYMYSYPHKTAYRPLPAIDLRQFSKYLEGSGHGLYLHVPFCQTKCGYCNLFSVTGQDAAAFDSYLEAVKRQSSQYQELLCNVQASFSQLVIGGGTPLLLPPRLLERMFAMLARYFQYDEKREFVIETAPNQTDAEKLPILKRAGVTRVSIGVQSFHDAELVKLGRGHCAKKAREALHLLKCADFPCVNVDFIYGIPGQTTDSLLTSLKEALTFQPDEIFLYPLYVRYGTKIGRQAVVPDAKAAYAQYENASGFLKSEGYRQDSMRRFVRGKRKRQYSECGFGNSLALGCGGRSYVGNLHFCSPYTVTRSECLAAIEAYERTVDFTKITHGILLSNEELKRRYIIRHLFIMPGLSLRKYQNAFQSNASDDFPVLQSWIERGFVRIQNQADEHEEEYAVLTETGMGLSDYLGPQLISAQVREAMEAWKEMHENDFIPRQSEKL